MRFEADGRERQMCAVRRRPVKDAPTKIDPRFFIRREGGRSGDSPDETFLCFKTVTIMTPTRMATMLTSDIGENWRTSPNRNIYNGK